MNCVDCQNLLAEFALDALGPHETDQVAAHLAGGCTTCQQSLDGARETWTALACTLPPASPPEHVKAELLARIRADSPPSSVRRGHPLSPESESEPIVLARVDQDMQRGWRWQSALRYVAATIIGIALGFGLTPIAPLDTSLVDRYNAQLVHAERTFGTPQMRFAALHVSENRAEVRGYMIWDNVATQLHVYAFDLGMPPPGSGYRLWFVSDDQAWVDAGDLQASSNSVCSTIIDVPALAKPLSRVVVTTEPTAASNTDGKPHGPIGLTAAFRLQ